MNLAGVFLSGLIGGTVMSLGLALARALGMERFNLELMLGTMLLPPGAAAFALGMVMHLTVSGAIAFLYAWGFERWTHRSGASIGARFGALHATAAGLGFGVWPALHPRMPEVLPAPGAFMANMGIIGVAALIGLNMIYGAVVGALYSRAATRAGGPLRA